MNEIAPTLNPRQVQVLEAFEQRADDLTNMEIAAALEWSINRVTGRVKELRERGILTESRTRPCSVTGRLVNAWRIDEMPPIRPQALRSAPTHYQLPSRSNPAGMHVLKVREERITCSCRGFRFRGKCSHADHLKKKAADPREQMTPLFG